MAKWAIVVDDPVKAHAADIARNAQANIAAHLKARPDAGPVESARLASMVHKAVRTRAGEPKRAGDRHVADPIDDACPEGAPNCRNCGDPAFAASCLAAGHCQSCGRSAGVVGLLPPPVGRGGHGIAPQGYLAATGLRLDPMPE